MTTNFNRGSNGSNARDVADFHNRDDVDSSSQAHHHTLGGKTGQAAPGNTLKKLVEALQADGSFEVGTFKWNFDPTENEYWKVPTGQSLVVADYQELFDYFEVTLGNGYFFGGAGANFNLPNLTDGKGLITASDTGLTFDVGDIIGNQIINAAHDHEVNVPSHTHSVDVPSHTHTLGDSGWAQIRTVTTTVRARNVAATGWTETPASGRVVGTDGTESGTQTEGAALDGVTDAHNEAAFNSAAHDEAPFRTSGTTDWDGDFFDTETFVNYSPSLVAVIMIRVKNPLDGLAL